MNIETRIIRTTFLEWLHGTTPIERCLSDCFQENRIGARDRKLFRKAIFGFLRFYGDIVHKSQKLSGIESSRLFEQALKEFFEIQGQLNSADKFLERHENLKPSFEKDPFKHLTEIHGISFDVGARDQTREDFQFLHSALHAQMQEPAMSLRSDLHLISAESVKSSQSRLAELGFVSYPQMPGAFYKEDENGDQFLSLDSTLAGVHFQDFSSQLVSWVVNPQPDDQILDFCAGAGGKTKHMLDLSKGKSEICAYDLDYHRIKPLQEYARRNKDLRLKVLFDKDVGQLKGKTFNKVLVDAPCSGLGTLRRHPDLIYRQKQSALQKFPSIQKELIFNALKYLAPNGTLTYSTCTIRPEENFAVVKEILNMDKDKMKLLNLSVGTGAEILAQAKSVDVAHYLNKLNIPEVGFLIPSLQKPRGSQTSGAWLGDGFFIAQLQLLE